MSDDEPSKEEIEKWLDSLESSRGAIPHLPEGESMYGDDRQILGWDSDARDDEPDCFVKFDDGTIYRVDTFVDRWTGEVEGEDYATVMHGPEFDPSGGDDGDADRRSRRVGGPLSFLSLSLPYKSHMTIYLPPDR